MLSKLVSRGSLRTLGGAMRTLSYSRRQVENALTAEDANEAKAETGYCEFKI